MAKTKTKKKTKKLRRSLNINWSFWIISTIVLLLGAAAFCMVFVNAVQYGENDRLIYTGWNISFGFTDTYANLDEYNVLGLNLVAFSAYVLPAVACILAFFDKNKIVKYITYVLFGASALMLFGMFLIIGINDVDMSAFQNVLIQMPDTNLSAHITTGTILGGIFSTVALLVQLIKNKIVDYYKVKVIE